MSWSMTAMFAVVGLSVSSVACVAASEEPPVEQTENGKKVEAPEATQKSCYYATMCKVGTTYVLPTDSDDPATWCSAQGGTLVRRLACN